MILRDEDEILTLNMKHDIASYSNLPHRDSVNLINIFNLSSEDCLEVLVSNQQSGNPTFSLQKEITSPEVTHEIHDSKGSNFLSEELPDIDSFNDVHPYFDDDPLSGSNTYLANSLLEEFTDELALITYPLDYDDNRTYFFQVVHETIDADDLEEMDLKWSVLVETTPSNALVSQCDDVGSYDWSFQAEEEPTNYALMAFSSLSSSFDNEIVSCSKAWSDASLTPSPIYDRYQSGNGYHVVPPPYTGTFMPPKLDLVFNNAPTDVETDHPAFTVKLSLTKPDQELSHTIRPSTPIIEDLVSDSEDEFETKTPQNVPSFVQSMSKGNHKHYAPMTHQNPQRHIVPAVVLTQSKLVPITAVRPVSTAVPKTNVTRPKQVKAIVTKTTSPPKRHTNRSLSLNISTSPPKVTAVKALIVSAAQGVIDSGCSRHMIRSMSYLSDFKELNGGYVAFGELKFNLFSVSQMCDKKNSVLFTDTECLVLSSNFKLSDANQVLVRVPKENNMYNVNLKNIIPSGDLTCLFAKATLDESNLWHRRLSHVNFKTINKLVKGNLVRGLPSKVFTNDNSYVTCKKGKQHRAS
nr:ribonuclease H-like domain-containing protein [Tanacetum cinerariifolium]